MKSRKDNKGKYGDCTQCGKTLSEHRITGHVNNKSVRFCSFKCCDDYKDKENANT